MHLNSQRLPLILAVLAGTAMLVVTLWQGYSFWQSEKHQTARAAQQRQAPLAVTKRKAPEIDLASIALFGKPLKPGEAAPTDTENLPETNLRLFLRGVMAADGDFPGSALIEDDERNTEAYLVGEELPGNARLRSIFPNRVVIERSGKLENLFFPESDSSSGVNVAYSRPEPEPEPEPDVQEPEIRSVPVLNPRNASPEERRENIRKRLQQLRARLRTNN